MQAIKVMLARSYLSGGLVVRPFRPDLWHVYAFVTSSMVTPSRLALEFLQETRRHFGIGG